MHRLASPPPPLPPCSSNHIRICTCIALHSAAPDKPEKEITAEIQAIIRQASRR